MSPRHLVAIGLVVMLAAGCAAGRHSPDSPAPALGGHPSNVSVVARSGSAVELVAASHPPPAAADPSAGHAVARAEQRFALRLLQHLNDAGGANNVTICPLSLAVALEMLETGARGQTLSEIAATLGTSSLDVAGQDAGWAWLTGTLTRQSRSDGITLDSANSLWLQNGLPLQPQFMSAMARYFATGVWQVDFTKDLSAAQTAINGWVSSHTEGKITQLFGPGDINPETLLVLANAVNFDAAWQAPFDPNRSEPGVFHPTPAETTQVTYMEGPVAHAAVTPAYAAVELPYTGGQFEALAVVPRAESLHRFVGSLTVGELDQIVSSATESGEVRLPRFTTESYLQLDQALGTMGMPTAFTAAADFSAMSPIGLQVQSVVQRDYLEVGEKGTRAAAASGISMMPSAIMAPPPIVVTFDQPFLFAIRDATTGALVFASVVQNPSP